MVLQRPERVARKNEGKLWLMGGGGTGKSVVSAKVIEKMRDADKPLVDGVDVVWHFCLHTNPADNTPLKILTSLAAQMCELDEGFRAQLAAEAQLSEALSGQLKTLEMFGVLLKHPMEALGARERKLLIVIDALDELPHDGTQDRVLRLLADAFSTLPEWVKIFTTSREGGDQGEIGKIQADGASR